MACCSTSGFGRADLLAVLFTCLLLFCLVGVLFVWGSKRTHSKLSCYNNLMQIGVAEKLFELDHGFAPWGSSTNHEGTFEYSASPEQTFRLFQIQSNCLNALILLICPQDTRQQAASWESLANTNVSYFVGIDSKSDLPTSILGGDRNITPLSNVILKANESAPLNWIKSVGLHGDKGHLIFGDGHVEELDSPGLDNAIQRTGIATNRFAIP